LSVARDDAAQPCGSDAFMAPRLTPPKFNEASSTIDGVSYTQIAVDVGKQFDVSISGFKLKGSGEGIQSINKLLTADMPATAAGSDYAECMKSNLSSSGRDGTYNVSLAPVVLTKSWLVARRSSDDFCGGAHPNAGSIDRVYDLRTGDVEEVEKWFLPEAMQVEDGTSPKGALREIVIKKEITHGSVECSDAYEHANYWNIALSKGGVNFTPSLSHAEAACQESIDVPFAVVLKFMNARGISKLKSFRAEVHK